MLKYFVMKSRSIRRFDNRRKIDPEIMEKLVNLSTLTPSAKNLQPLKYIISVKREINDIIFPNLSWAGYLKDWNGPSKNEEPTGYIIVLGDKKITDNFCYDPGIVSHTMMMGAIEYGLGGCIIGSVNRENLRKQLEIDDRYEILLVLALGYPDEEVILDTVGDNGDIKYYRDEEDRHWVPKRKAEELILRIE